MEDEKPKRFERKPNLDLRAKLSRDGRFWIITRIETWIIPRKYMDVIAQNHNLSTNISETPRIEEKRQRKGKRNANGDGQGN